MNILLVRHGETAWNREGRYQGRTDIPLSADGERQVARARRAAGARADRGRVRLAAVAREDAPPRRSSPAATTTLELDDGLLEISHGEWEGQLASDIELSHAEMFGDLALGARPRTPAGPGAETLGDVEARAWAVLERLCARLGPDDTALIAAHDAVNRVLLCRVLGLPLERVWMFRQAPATLNVLAGPSLAELQIVRLNDTEHAAPLLRGPAQGALTRRPAPGTGRSLTACRRRSG